MFLECGNGKKMTYLIAELCGNHGGNAEMAQELVRNAKASGAHAVKFQTYVPDLLIDRDIEALPHVKKLYDTQHQRFTDLCLSEDEWLSIVNLCSELKIDFGSTPADSKSLEFIGEHCSFLKIQSGDVTNHLLIEQVAVAGKPVILSTGMATEKEIAQAVDILRNCDLTLLHCVSNYPCEISDLRLGAIAKLRDRFNVRIGYSDHCADNLACVFAVAAGAEVIERHFTITPEIEIGDHRFSATPAKFREMRENIEKINVAFSRSEIDPSQSEVEMTRLMRRGLAVGRDLKAGDLITKDDLLYIRPETSVHGDQYRAFVGKRAARELRQFEQIGIQDIEI